MMKAVRIHAYGAVDLLRHEDVSIPEIAKDHVLDSCARKRPAATAFRVQAPGGRELGCQRGTYHIGQPITQVKDGTLVLNYYPTGPAPRRGKRPDPIVMLNVGDPFYFGWY